MKGVIAELKSTRILKNLCNELSMFVMTKGLVSTGKPKPVKVTAAVEYMPSGVFGTLH